jgi:hypothetical protein
MAIALGWLVLAVACGIFADKRGRSGVGWFFIALLASPLVAGVFLLVIPEKTPASQFSILRRCNSCREQIRRDASICKHCGSADPFKSA